MNLIAEYLNPDRKIIIWGRQAGKTALKQAIMDNACEKCKQYMGIGLALVGQEKEENIRAEYDCKRNEDLELKECLKCPACGFSKNL